MKTPRTICKCEITLRTNVDWGGHLDWQVKCGLGCISCGSAWARGPALDSSFLPTQVPGGSGDGFLPLIWETWIEFPDPGFALVHPQLLRVFRECASKQQISFSLYVLCVSAFQRNRKFSKLKNKPKEEKSKKRSQNRDLNT